MGLALPASAAAASLTLAISGVNSDAGRLYVELFDSAEAMESDAPMAQRWRPAEEGTMTLTFDGLTVGERYALQLYHDANDNQELDTNLVGMPKEGYGLSTNFEPKLSAPDFGDIAFTLESEAAQRRIKMQY